MDADEQLQLIAEAKNLRDTVASTGARAEMDIEYLMLAALARIDEKLGRLLGEEPAPKAKRK